MSLKAAVDSFLNHLTAEKGYSANTLHAYRNDLYQIAESVNKQNISGEDTQHWQSVDPALLTDHIVNLREVRGYSLTTLARKIAALRSFFGFLREEGLITNDPTSLLSSPRIGRQLPKPLSVDDVNLLLKKASKGSTPESSRDYAMLHLLYATGVRVTELINLDVNDINLEEAFVRCLGKGSKERLIPIHAQAVEILDSYVTNHRNRLAIFQEEQALFLNHRGARLTRQGFWLILKHYGRQAGIDRTLTPHTLRHSFATHMLQGGAPLRYVQELLGHASITTTQVYTQISDKHLEDSYNRAHPRA